MDLTSQVQKEKELFKTMKDIMTSSAVMATSYTEDVIEEMKSKPDKFKINESTAQYLDDCFFKSKAEHAISKLQGVDPEKLYGIGKIFGNKTLCDVPGGKFDTRSITAKKSRVYNNRLDEIVIESSDEEVIEVLPLMQSNLKLSFNRVTQEFSDASKKFSFSSSS